MPGATVEVVRLGEHPMDPGYRHPPVAAGAPQALPQLLVLLLQPEQTRTTVNNGLGTKWQECFGGDINCVSACMHTCTCYVNACIHTYIYTYTNEYTYCMYVLWVGIHTYMCVNA